jgi:hypothetical protein
MRELTGDEKAALYGEGRCPFCRGKEFLEGPHGGLSVNIECDRCGARFNTSPIPSVGQLIGEPRGDQRKWKKGFHL